MARAPHSYRYWLMLTIIRKLIVETLMTTNIQQTNVFRWKIRRKFCNFLLFTSFYYHWISQLDINPRDQQINKLWKHSNFSKFERSHKNNHFIILGQAGLSTNQWRYFEEIKPDVIYQSPLPLAIFKIFVWNSKLFCNP